MPTRIAGEQQNPSSIATTATELYWIDVPEFADASMLGRVMHTPLGGGAPIVLADAQPCPVAVTTEPSAVYWVRCDGAVLTVPASGGDVRTLLAPGTISNFHPLALATTADAIYVLTSLSSGPGAIMRVSKQPQVAPDVAAVNLPHPVALAVDATSLYWLDATDGAVYQRTAAVGYATPATRVASAENGMAIAVDAARIYYVDFGANGDKQVHSVPIGGGAVVDYDTQGSSATAVAVDATDVYWIAPGMQAVLRAPLAGGVTETVAVSRGTVANAIALSADQVFFADDPTTRGSEMPTTLEAAAK